MAKIYIPDGKGNYIPFPVLKGDKGDKGDKGQDGADVEFAIIEGFLCYRYPENEWVQIISVEDITGPKGDTGTVFVPSVDADGNISWSNNADLENPETVNIKGQQGEKGETGEKGEQGIQGENGADGYTPIKGTDYFTPEEIENITSSLETTLKQYIDEQISQLQQTPEVTDPNENPVTPEETNPNENTENTEEGSE